MMISSYMWGLIFVAGACYGDKGEFNNLYIKYHVSTDLQNWHQALINCKSAGMELASIKSEIDQKNLEKFLTENGYDRGYWLSGTSLGNGDFAWASTGNPVDFTKWLPNQPDNAKLPENDFRGERCIQWGIYNKTADPAGWNDLFCRHKLQYICEESEYCNHSNKIE